MKHLVTEIRNGCRFFHAGKFNDAKNAFGDILTKIPLIITDSKGEAKEMKEVLQICWEYIMGIQLRAAAMECGDDPVWSTELLGYFMHCNLQPMHLLLAL